MIVIAIVNQIVVSYFDLQLTYYRNMIVLGTLCGLIPTLANSCDEAPVESEESKEEKWTENFPK
jgi:hypothetical protein